VGAAWYYEANKEDTTTPTVTTSETDINSTASVDTNINFTANTNQSAIKLPTNTNTSTNTSDEWKKYTSHNYYLEFNFPVGYQVVENGYGIFIAKDEVGVLYFYLTLILAKNQII